MASKKKGSGLDDPHRPDDASPDTQEKAARLKRLQADLGEANRLAQILWLGPDPPMDEMHRLVDEALQIMRDIAPDGEIEAMLARQMIATHSAAMECFRRAMNPEQTFVGRDQNLKHAAKLVSIYTRQLEALDKHRGKGQQKVTVEYVHVAPGGQAVVGNIETGGGKRRQGAPSPAPSQPRLGHRDDAPIEMPIPREAVDVEPSEE